MLGAGVGAGAVSWLRTRWRQVAGRCWRWVLGAGRRCWCCELAVHVVETNCWCLVPGTGAGCWYCELAVRGGGKLLAPVLVLSAGRRCWCWCCGLAVHVVETGCWCLPGACRVPGAGSGAGAVNWLRTWWRQVAGAGAGAGCRCWCWWCSLRI